MAAEQRSEKWDAVGVALAWLATRGLLVFLGFVAVSWYPGGTIVQADLDVYVDWLPTIESGALPTDDMWQYPPAAAFFFAIGLWGSQPQIALLLGILAVDALLTAVLYRNDRLAGWFWVAAGIAIGPVLVFRFDVVPALFAVLAVLAAGRPVRVGVWAALGAAAKVWPVLLLAILPRRDFLRGVGAFLVTTLVLLIGCAVMFADLGGFLSGQRDRGLQVESVAALPFMVANAAGLEVEISYRYGAMEVASTGTGLAATALTVGLLAILLWLAWCWWRGVLAAHLPADVAFTVVLASVIFSRVFSPQYSVWLLALGSICVAATRSRMVLPVLLIAAAAVPAQFVYPIGYGEFLSGNSVYVLAQVVRVGLVVSAGVIAVVRISRPTEQATVTSAAEDPAPSAAISRH
jgi:uncharacterized membrane protein